MDIIHLIFVLAVLGCIFALVTTYIPMPAPVRTVITVIAVIALCLFLLDWAGIGGLHLRGRL